MSTGSAPSSEGGRFDSDAALARQLQTEEDDDQANRRRRATTGDTEPPPAAAASASTWHRSPSLVTPSHPDARVRMSLLQGEVRSLLSSGGGPNVDLRALFLLYNDALFGGTLAAVKVEWSNRMKLIAGSCSYQRAAGFCRIGLSSCILQFRPIEDTLCTLLHEMIHGYLFVGTANCDRDDHGPQFQFHMHRINALLGVRITIYHSFHDEVNFYRTHVWRCQGPCRLRPPYYGTTKRSMNRAPGKSDTWWAQHQAECGGTFVKVAAPEPTDKQKRDDERRKERERRKDEKDKQAGFLEAYVKSSPIKRERPPPVATTPAAAIAAGPFAASSSESTTSNKRKRRPTNPPTRPGAAVAAASTAPTGAVVTAGWPVDDDDLVDLTAGEEDSQPTSSVGSIAFAATAASSRVAPPRPPAAVASASVGVVGAGRSSSSVGKPSPVKKPRHSTAAVADPNQPTLIDRFIRAPTAAAATAPAAADQKTLFPSAQKAAPITAAGAAAAAAAAASAGGSVPLRPPRSTLLLERLAADAKAKSRAPPTPSIFAAAAGSKKVTGQPATPTAAAAAASSMEEVIEIDATDEEQEEEAEEVDFDLTATTAAAAAATPSTGSSAPILSLSAVERAALEKAEEAAFQDESELQ